MIALDFLSGSHGHFLEYLVNTYIFRGPRVDNIFTDLGTSHNIRDDSDYMNFRLVEAAHYSEFNFSFPTTPSKIIRISVDSEIEQICYQINVFCRAGDIPAENKLMDIPEQIRHNTTLLRNDLYSKLKGYGYSNLVQWRWNNVEAFTLPMGALYNIYELYCYMNKLALFLGHSFNPDNTMTQLWKQFMLQNHGWNYWINSNSLLEKILNNDNVDFTSDVWLQALINYQLSNAIGLNDGPLHTTDSYPTNTSEIYKLIQKHISEFDQLF